MRWIKAIMGYCTVFNNVQNPYHIVSFNRFQDDRIYNISNDNIKGMIYDKTVNEKKI